MRATVVPRRALLFCCGVSLAMATHALTSQPLIITLDGDPATSFWRTAPTGSFEIGWEMPPGAKSATLSVTGMGYSHEVADLTGTSCTVDFLPDEENVYTFKLTFDTGVEQTASVSRIATRGVNSVTDVPIRLGAYDSTAWRRTKSPCNVLPIPAGTESFTVDGVAHAWSGEAGWYGFGPLEDVTTYTLALDGVTRWVDFRPKGGFSLFIR